MIIVAAISILLPLVAELGFGSDACRKDEE